MGEMPNRPDEHDHDDDLGGGAELHPDVVSAADELSGPTASEGDIVSVPDNPNVVPIFFDATTGDPLVPDLEDPQ